MNSSKEHIFQITTSSQCAKSHVKKYQDGIAEGYEIVCMDGSFYVHEYCLHNSEFLYNMMQGSDTSGHIANVRIDKPISLQCIKCKPLVASRDRTENEKFS